jgi:ubiquinone/menaquinone biosynthesis C-methylase UbiE
MTSGNQWDGIQRCTADALNLPFGNRTFNVVISGFLMRNVSSVAQALSEQYRVLKPGSKIVILDTTRPRSNILSPLIRFYLRYVIPFLGTLITVIKKPIPTCLNRPEIFSRLRISQGLYKMLVLPVLPSESGCLAQ